MVPTLDWEIKEGNIAYFQLHNFNSNVPSLFYEAAIGALVKGAKGMVLDLRNNPGGFLDVAVNVSGWFFEKGSVVVKEKFRGGDDNQFRTYGNGAFAHMPIVVIVNSGSASAAEIVAGALRDNRNVKLIGEKTFGKGSVQEIEHLKDGSTLKVSVAAWLTPKDIEIDKKGLVPDFEVKITDEDAEKGRDPQLEKALSLIRPQL